jgi:hypothetical protein
MKHAQLKGLFMNLNITVPAKSEYGFKKKSDGVRMGLLLSDFAGWAELCFLYLFPKRFRINNQLSISSSLSGSNSHNNVGYVSTIEEDIHFGVRDVKSFTNILTTKFTFNKEMDLYFRMRHYWSSAKYDDYYLLGDDGRLDPTDYYEIMMSILIHSI